MPLSATKYLTAPALQKLATTMDSHKAYQKPAPRPFLTPEPMYAFPSSNVECATHRLWAELVALKAINPRAAWKRFWHLRRDNSLPWAPCFRANDSVYTGRELCSHRDCYSPEHRRQVAVGNLVKIRSIRKPQLP